MLIVCCLLGLTLVFLINICKFSMTEKLKNALIELGKGILSALVGFLGALAVTSCGSTTKAIIRNGADSTSTTVSITTNNPTNWQLTPDVSLNYKP